MRKKNKKYNTENMLHHNESISKKMIEIHEEAYYRALKRIEEENESHNIREEKREYKWYEKILLVINFLFWLIPSTEEQQNTSE